LSDDLLYTHSSARVETKAEFLAALRSGELKYEAMNHEDLKVRVYGDTALVTGRSAVRVRSRGQENNLQIRFLAVYVRKAGHWQMVAWQSTRFPQP
jgi:ketosteroid isomerase-like protein